ncbi:hypothetical protein P879_05416 [Paragonimus westermani]|uniref:DUF4806 domain-containing protein n=1 Tax=Paragonimus westermani TaxID=34504 RepID=A0A8T0DCU8_9TREM|nr:hypothetical protein P879_05416 [Paragonimus westermani]
MTAKITRLANRKTPCLPLPVTSVTQLEEVDRKMLQFKFQSAMADYFQGISAPSAAALVRNMMERLMTKTVAAQTTYSCAHNTFAFKRTQLKAFLIGRVCHILSFLPITRTSTQQDGIRNHP